MQKKRRYRCPISAERLRRGNVRLRLVDIRPLEPIGNIPSIEVDNHPCLDAELDARLSVADALSGAEAIILSPIVIGELYDGFIGGSRLKANRAEFDRFRAKSRTLCVPITGATVGWFAEVKRQLRAKGRSIPANDVWIAAGCLEHGAVLVSFDAHFSAIDGLLRWEQ